MPDPQYLNNFESFKTHVAQVLNKEGWEVQSIVPQHAPYDFIVRTRNKTGIVHLRWLLNLVQRAQLVRFVNFLETPEASQFDVGLFITTKGFSKPAEGEIRGLGSETKLKGGVVYDSGVCWWPETPVVGPPPPTRKLYFGVFTCKGGVGKTTIAAHLAGVFALQGFDVALVDLDPEQNLRKLLGEGVNVPPDRGCPNGASVEVFSEEDWHEDAARGSQIVICDCSPALERNPAKLVRRFDYCLVPTTFNPLGLNKNGKVIEDTAVHIRKLNPEAEIFVVVNNFRHPGTQRLNLLQSVYSATFERLKGDRKFHCIDPAEVCIRSSDQLYYWGIELLEGQAGGEAPRSELAFKLIGGRSYPRSDFLALAEYIEEKAGLGRLRPH